MKTILATLATIFVGLVALPEKVEARPGHGHTGSSYTYRSGHSSCGCATYTRRVIVSYDCHRRPVYRYYSVPVVHNCRSHYSHRSHSTRHHYSHRGHSSHRGITIRGPHGSVRICR
ncbi:hypothetical protein JO972_11985 [Verrucomicrobiaceae bacterium 5K15]|uniref:Uncharacterized protein n=1 Tax=Oceaniferula flava TaxID=2800421 RepID=A0AAE2SD49_9BACT|nr:hypothetical protein [Oceaniferula flavus]MBK1855683.1 hypothetical protein [Oceaniferula flavus]MBM1136989.1 hypothetical protein [Oceaniferula flavus]